MNRSEDLDKRLNPIRRDGSCAQPIDQCQVAIGHTALLGAPIPDAQLESQLLFGEQVDVYEVCGEFSWVRNRTDGYVGYVATNTLENIGPKCSHRVSALRTYVYPKPDLKTQPIDLLSVTSTVHTYGEKNGFSNTPYGWVWSAHLSPVDKYETNLTAVACAFLGTPYLWGGRTSVGLDCSALVQLTLKSCGVNVPRDTDLQENNLPKLTDWSGNEKDLISGDLIFWHGHVAIWLGNNHLIHANATDMAVTLRTLQEVKSHIQKETGSSISSICRISQSLKNN